MFWRAYAACEASWWHGVALTTCNQCVLNCEQEGLSLRVPVEISFYRCCLVVVSSLPHLHKLYVILSCTFIRNDNKQLPNKIKINHAFWVTREGRVEVKRAEVDAAFCAKITMIVCLSISLI